MSPDIELIVTLLDSRYLQLKGTPCVRVALVIFATQRWLRERTIGEECNRCFIDEAWVSKCRLVAENAGALSAAGPARREKGRTIPGPGGPEGKGEQITPNKLVSRFVSVVFNTDKEIERIL